MNSNSRKYWGILIVVVLALVALTASMTGVLPALAAPMSDEDPCAALMGLELENTTITLAEAVPAGGGLPTYCKVAGYVDTEINFEVWMPVAESWNGKFNGVGNGGLAGFINYDALTPAVALGYAAASTDTGHVGLPVPGYPPFPGFDASWALNEETGELNWERLENFGHAGTHKMTLAAKAIVGAYYGQDPAYSYFTGCSGGGQQGLAEAQRYPDDYDGIVTGAPANFPTYMWPGEFYPAVLVKDMDIGDLESKLELIEGAVLDECDALDGVVDGLLEDPRRCDFDPATLQCEEGDDPAACLTAEQVDVVQKIYAGLHDPKPPRKQIWPGFEPSSEPNWGGHLHPFAIQIGYFKYMVFKDPEWDWTTFDFEDNYDDWMGSHALLGPILNATDRDLKDFQKQGSKMIMYHGWIDQNIAPRNSINYYESVKRKGQEGDFFRLFMVPGMGHCGGGPGPFAFDALGALEQWVENGVEPDRIIGTNPDSGLTRPLCPYPTIATYTGSGDTNDPDNFVCQESKPHDEGKKDDKGEKGHK